MLTTRRRQTGAENESVNVSQTSGETFAGEIFCTGLLHTLSATVHVSHFLLWRSAFPQETFFSAHFQILSVDQDCDQGT